MCEAFLEPHHVVSRQGYRAKVVLGSAEWGRLGLIIGPGGPQRLLILCGNPPPKAAGPFASLLPYAPHARFLPVGPPDGSGDRRGNVLVLLYQGEIALGIFEVRLFRGAVDAPTMRARAGYVPRVPSSRRPSFFLRASLFYRSPRNTPQVFSLLRPTHSKR